jgi:hypothetical protein
MKYLPNSYSNNHKSGDNEFKTEVETQFIIALEKKEIQTLINASVLPSYQVLIFSWSYGLYGKLQLLVQSPLSFVDNVNRQQEIFFTWLSLVSLCGLLTILEAMSLSRSAQCVMLHSKIGWTKLKNVLVWLKKTVLAQHNCTVCGRVWRLVKGTATTKNSVIYMIWLLVTVSDWPIIMIGPGGLLLVVPHLFAVPVSVLWVGLQKSK